MAVKQIIDEDMERDERFKKQFEFAIDSFPKTKDFLRVFRKWHILLFLIKQLLDLLEFILFRMYLVEIYTILVYILAVSLIFQYQANII